MLRLHHYRGIRQSCHYRSRGVVIRYLPLPCYYLTHSLSHNHLSTGGAAQRAFLAISEPLLCIGNK